MIIKKIDNAQELDALVRIDTESFTSAWKKDIYAKMLTSTLYELFGIYVGVELAGFICVSDTTEVIEIIRVAVSPKFRNNGYGEELLKHIELNSVRDQLFLEVRSGNLSAINLYKKFGFKDIGIRKKYYKDTNEDALIMSKKIDRVKSERI